jgi:predicted deacylase
MLKSMKRRELLGVLYVLGIAAIAASGAKVKIPTIPPASHDVRPGPGVKTRMLSDYFPAVAHTPGDTAVYVIEGQERGGTVFLAGGTHPGEIAGSMAAIVLVEQARVRRGRLIVIPYANNSASTYPDPRRPGSPRTFSITTTSGTRTFVIGARLTKLEHQGEPDLPGEQARSPEEAVDILSRNLDRQYPGKPDGNLTQRVAYAVVSLIRKEKVDLAFDLHEAPPGSRLAMMVVANPKNSELAAEALLALEVEGVKMKLEESSDDFRGLSHREWGDATPAKAFLFETPDPAFLRERPGDPVNDPEWPLAKRVGIHIETLLAIIDAYNSGLPATKQVELLNLPSLEDLTKFGLGHFLR